MSRPVLWTLSRCLQKASWFGKGSGHEWQPSNPPSVGVSHPNMAVGRLLNSELPNAACCKTIVIFGRSAPFYWHKVFVLGMQAKGDVPPLNEVSKVPLVDLSNRWLRSEQLGLWDQVCVCNPQWGVLDHILKIWGWRPDFTGLPTKGIGVVTLHLSIRHWVPVTG